MYFSKLARLTLDFFGGNAVAKTSNGAKASRIPGRPGPNSWDAFGEKLIVKALAPVTQKEIEELAYSLWENAGCPEGDGIEFWLEAERQLEWHQPERM